MALMNNFNKQNPIYGANMVDGWMGAQAFEMIPNQIAILVDRTAQVPVVFFKSSGIQYPQSMEERWQTVHAEYVDKAAWVKQMLAL